MSSLPSSPDNYCYRHPDRQSFILCQRCGRTVCPECQTQAPVGVHCPECVREHQASAPRRKPAVVTAINRARRGEGAVVTYSILGLTVLVYLLQLVTGGVVTNALLYWGPYTDVQPWRLITTALVHSQNSFFHILFNMYALWLFGRMLEGMLGHWRFLALYVLSALGGSVAVLLLSPLTPVVGASGAIFGLFGAFFVINRGLGGNSVQLVIVLALNLAIGFIVPGIAWQAHVGGILVGALIGFILLRTRHRNAARRQRLLLAAVAGGLVVLTVIGVVLMYARFG
ncbi:rhomboid family intramembrane serine protease [Salinibacterium sp. dk2585]|uniref:rhomboid family intramembrane serine protease n=1 Tax=unclassified Salinibacterium TaxID=2632331 RepID=UPI0011C2556F|nr:MULTISPECIES: rhomboid family intramembrane serine protease [unclassified Salinibacterium]QEE62464.1 rhomboid family intramembrane serine protease [Salinibacterium sp. dk2585]TXK55179.1 rhomboid family intramembrane serine protease [Salinibacterium sp. dk5596]